MKKYILLPLIAMLVTVFSASAQENAYPMIIKMADGTIFTIGANEVQKVSFTNGQVTVSGESIQSMLDAIAATMSLTQDTREKTDQLETIIANFKQCECDTKGYITKMEVDYSHYTKDEIDAKMSDYITKDAAGQRFQYLETENNQKSSEIEALQEEVVNLNTMVASLKESLDAMNARLKKLEEKE
jgi:peptidoglycan hydrolase CwlO-like protein